MPTTPITPPRRKALEVLAAAAGDAIPIRGTTTTEPPAIGATSARWLIGEGFADEAKEGGTRTAAITEAGLAYALELERATDAPPPTEDDAAKALADTFGPGEDDTTEAPADDEHATFADIDTAATTTTVSGTLPRLTRPLGHREVITIVAQVEVTALNFPATKHGIARRQTAAILDGFELAGKVGRELINSLKLAHDPSPLPFGAKADTAIAEAAIAGITDASGIVVTPGDAAALGLAGGAGTVAVIWANGARCAWPDDFPKDTPRPNVGDFCPIPGAPEHTDQVTELLDMATGQPLEGTTGEGEEE